MKISQMIAAVVGAQCALAMDAPTGDRRTAVLRVSARGLVSKDRILGIKTSEADPFYRLWSCADSKCHNKHLIAQVSDCRCHRVHRHLIAHVAYIERALC